MLLYDVKNVEKIYGNISIIKFTTVMHRVEEEEEEEEEDGVTISNMISVVYYPNAQTMSLSTILILLFAKNHLHISLH